MELRSGQFVVWVMAGLAKALLFSMKIGNIETIAERLGMISWPNWHQRIFLNIGGLAMTNVEKRVVERFKALLSERVSLFKMVLFGSRARGDADPASDMDVVVILESPLDEKVKEEVSECAWQAGFEDGIVLVPVVFSRDEWENGTERHSLFVQAVQAEGVVL